MNKIVGNNLVLISDIYPDNIIVIPIEDRSLFPEITIPLTYTGEELINLINYSLEKNNGFIGVSLINFLIRRKSYKF